MCDGDGDGDVMVMRTNEYRCSRFNATDRRSTLPASKGRRSHVDDVDDVIDRHQHQRQRQGQVAVMPTITIPRSDASQARWPERYLEQAVDINSNPNYFEKLDE